MFSIFAGLTVADTGGTADTGTSNNDTIVVGNGNNDVIGGPGSDHLNGIGHNNITAGNGNNYLIGDDGLIDFTNIAGANFVGRAELVDPLYFGNSTIVAGNGVNSIIGGSGSNTITVGNTNTAGSGSDDIILGSDGEIVQAFSNGKLILNSDGTAHRDVVLEQVGQITASIALDSAGDAAVGDLAAIAGANLVLLTGEFTSGGSLVVSQAPANAWETQALLLSLLAYGNNTITVTGVNNSTIIGQGANNTITVHGGGNNTIFGNTASNTVPDETNIPSIIDAVDIVSSAVASIVVPATETGTTAQLVVPNINLLPSALTTNAPQLQVPPPGFGTLAGIPDSGNLALTGGNYLQVFASVVPSLLNGSPALPGSNTINVNNSGNNTIFGNYGDFGALVTTGITQIDNQLQGLSVTMLGLLSELSALSTVQDAVSGETPVDIDGGNNHITVVGAGNDTIFGNSGEYLVPDVAFAQGSGSLASNAVALDTYLLEMQEVFGDMSFVANQAGAAIISSYHGPAAHLLDFDNNTINLSASSGADLVAGNTGIVIMPGAGPAADNWATGVSSGTLQSVRQQLTGLESTFDSALKSQFAADHPFTATDAAAASTGVGFDLEIGNNTISGGAGNSILSGNTAIILDPVLGGGEDGSDTASAFQSIMVTAVDRLFLGAFSRPTADAEFGALPRISPPGIGRAAAASSLTIRPAAISRSIATTSAPATAAT